MGNLITSRMMGNQEMVGGVPADPDSSWWCRTLARALAVLAAACCMIAGVVVMISTSARCIIAGLLMIILGGVVMVFEAPICCTFVEFTKPIAAFSEKRTYLQKALIYVISALIPAIMCFGFGTVIGCGFVFAAGVFYGLMGLGKKADREQMMESAQTNTPTQMPPPTDFSSTYPPANTYPSTNIYPPTEEPKAGLFENQETYPTNRGFN